MIEDRQELNNMADGPSGDQQVRTALDGPLIQKRVPIDATRPNAPPYAMTKSASETEDKLDKVDISFFLFFFIFD